MTEHQLSQSPNGPENYDFNIGELIKRAHVLAKQNNWVLVQALLSTWAIILTVYFLFLQAYEISDVSKLLTNEIVLSQGQQIIMLITFIVVQAPLWTGVQMLAISFVRGRSLPFFSIFSYFKLLPMVALAYMIMELAFQLGLLFFILPGVYAYIATSFTLPLIADKKLTPLKALLSSIKMSNKYLSKMIILYALFLFLLFIVLITFGFAYLWIGPLYTNTKAILYQDLFCTREPVQYSKEENQSEGVFDA